MARLQRDSKREQIWRGHLEQQRSSGVTVRAYCLANALRETSFFYWKKEIARRDREAAPAAPASVAPAPAFVPVAVIDSPTARTESAIEIRLTGGLRVRVRSGCDRNLLADVLVMLRWPVTEGLSC
jgi:hypothetical protein